MKAALRIDETNLNHHLWKNRGTWWCHFTVRESATSKRMRFSLKTEDVQTARQIRDNIFKDLQKHNYM